MITGVFVSGIRCSDQQFPVNTEIVTVAAGYYLGDVKTYTCMRGYGLVSGSLSRQCTESGTFSGEAPYCDSKCQH